MRSVILSSLFICLSFFCSAQKQSNIWLFGNGDGLDFNVSPPARVSGITGTGTEQEGTACISDANGRLLFYTDGIALYNKQHRAMLDGYGINGHHSSQQSSIIVPLPGSDSIFYVFTSDVADNYVLKLPALGYNYSIVNMCLDWKNPESALGAVVKGKKNIRIADNGTEKLCAASDGANGYWILGHKMFSDSFFAWHLTSAGLSGTVKTRIGPIVGRTTKLGDAFGASGQMKFNPSGTKVGVANWTRLVAPTLDVFDFNPITGKLSNHCQTILGHDTSAIALGLEFSPNGSKVYITCFGALSPSQLIQYTLSPTCTSISNSRDTVYSSGKALLYGIQAGPDSKLYVGWLNRNFGDTLKLHLINNPDATKPMLGYDSAFTTLTWKSGNFIAPYPPNFVAGFRYTNGICICPQPLSVISQSGANELSIVPNPANEYVTIANLGKSSLPNLRLTIYDVTGRIIYNNAIAQSRIDIRAHPAGLYFYHISNEAGILKLGRFSVVH